MNKLSNVLLTALAPMIWGSTYIVTTQYLPENYPMTIAMLRALPAGLILLLITRELPKGRWWGRVFILGALNFSVFWYFLFVAAYRLPGGVAATVGAIQPMVVIFLAYLVLGNAIKVHIIFAALTGMVGVALLVLSATAKLDLVGVMAGLGGALSMAAGTVLTRKWQPENSLLTYTAWQLTAGGLLLLPLSLWIELPLPSISLVNAAGFVWLSVVGAALSYFLWFRGVALIQTTALSTLGFLSPVVAIGLGWSLLGEELSFSQVVGVLLVIASIVYINKLAK